MIRKLSFWVVVAIVVIVLTGIIFVKKKTTDSASLVPSHTILFAQLPDLYRTANRWNATALSKITEEPEMRAFLEKPLSHLQTHPGYLEALRILNALKPHNIFLAATDPSDLSSNALIGFEYRGSRKDFDEAIARMRKELPDSGTAPTLESHAGSEVLISQHGPQTLCTATNGNWGFVATSVDILKFALEGMKSARSDALANNPRYKAVLPHMLAQPDFFAFIQPEKLIDKLQEIGASMGAHANPAHFEELRTTQAIGATLKLDGDVQRDAIFILRPSAGTPSLVHKPIQFTTSETTLYFDFHARFELLAASITEALETGYNLPPDLTQLANLASAAYGPEVGIVANWPLQQMTPNAFLAVEIQDETKANDCLQKLLQIFPETTITEEDGVKIYNFPTISSPFVSPALTHTRSFLLLGPNATTVANAATLSGSQETLKDSPAFAPALPYYQSANEAFGFIDTRSIFERSYNALRPVLIFGAAVVPQYAEFIDTSKLPQTETIARHLSPIAFSKQALPDGTLVESSGPITINQAAMSGGVGAITLFGGFLKSAPFK